MSPAAATRTPDTGATGACAMGVERSPVRDAATIAPTAATHAAAATTIDLARGIRATLRATPRRYSKRQGSPEANDFRMRRATTMRCTSSGPS